MKKYITTKRKSMSDIRYYSLSSGSPFFSRHSMKLAKETMSNYSAGPMIDNEWQLFYRTGGSYGNKTFKFNHRTNKIETMN